MAFARVKDGVLVVGGKVIHHLCRCLVAGDLLGHGPAVKGVGVHCRLDDGGEIANLAVHLVVDVLV